MPAGLKMKILRVVGRQIIVRRVCLRRIDDTLGAAVNGGRQVPQHGAQTADMTWQPARAQLGARVNTGTRVSSVFKEQLAQVGEHVATRWHRAVRLAHDTRLLRHQTIGNQTVDTVEPPDPGST